MSSARRCRRRRPSGRRVDVRPAGPAARRRRRRPARPPPRAGRARAGLRRPRRRRTPEVGAGDDGRADRRRLRAQRAVQRPPRRAADAVLRHREQAPGRRVRRRLLDVPPARSVGSAGGAHLQPRRRRPPADQAPDPRDQPQGPRRRRTPAAHPRERRHRGRRRHTRRDVARPAAVGDVVRLGLVHHGDRQPAAGPGRGGRPARPRGGVDRGGPRRRDRRVAQGRAQVHALEGAQRRRPQDAVVRAARRSRR